MEWTGLEVGLKTAGVGRYENAKVDGGRVNEYINVYIKYLLMARVGWRR